MSLYFVITKIYHSQNLKQIIKTIYQTFYLSISNQNVVFFFFRSRVQCSGKYVRRVLISHKFQTFYVIIYASFIRGVRMYFSFILVLESSISDLFLPLWKGCFLNLSCKLKDSLKYYII